MTPLLSPLPARLPVRLPVRLRGAPGLWRRSIRTQLIAANILTLALLLCAFGVIVRLTVRTTMLSSVDHELDAWAHRLDHPHDDRDHDRRSPRRAGTGEPNPYRPRFFAPTGKPFESPGDAPKVWDAAALAQAEKGAVVHSTARVDGVSVRVLTRLFPANTPVNGPVLGVVQVPYALTDVDRAVNWLDRALLLLSPVALVCAGIGGALLTDRMLRRVRAMATAAERIGADDLAARLPATGDDEFSHLAATFNGLLGRVEAAFQAQERLIEMQRRFTADASHELKTPLTTIKGTASMALYATPSDEMYRQSLVEIDRAAGAMSHLVQDLLLLARADDGHLVETVGANGDSPIELLLGEVLHAALPPRVANTPRVPGASAPPVTVRLADEALTVVGKEDDLTRLFRNLIENAVRWTPPNGTVTVTADRAPGDPSTALITIADTGAGIAPEHLPHLGERFYRVDAARSRPDGGTGLGISISRSIAEAHGGGIAFESTVGVGTTVRVTLPAVPAGASEEN